jgi:Protein of unknown function (DUF2846)
MIKQVKFLPILLFLLSGCASSPQATSPGANKNFATVYFYRTHYAPGGAVAFDIQDNGLDIGALPDGSYFQYQANPGAHLFTLTTDSTVQQRVNLQAGVTYYIKADTGKNPLRFKPSLQVVFDLQGKTEIQNLKRLHYHE